MDFDLIGAYYYLENNIINTMKNVYKFLKPLVQLIEKWRNYLLQSIESAMEMNGRESHWNKLVKEYFQQFTNQIKKNKKR